MIYRQLFLFASVYFLLSVLLSLFTFLMDYGYHGFQFFYFHAPKLSLLLTIFGFVFLCYLVRKFCPQSDGSGYWDVFALIENKAQRKKTLDGKTVAAISYRDTIGRFFLTPLSALVGGSLGQTGPGLHLASSFAVLFKNKLFLPTGHLIYCALSCALIIFFNAPLAAIAFFVESSLRHRKNFNEIMQLFPFIVLSCLIAIFWQKLLGNWHWQFNLLGSQFFQLIDCFTILKLIFTALFLSYLWLAVYHHLYHTLDRFWHYQSFICGLLMAGLIYFSAAQLSGSGLDFIDNPNISIGFYDKWLANLVTLSSGISAGLIAPAIAIGALMANYFALSVGFSASVYLGLILKRPLMAAFLISEFLNYALIETLFGSLLAYFLFELINFRFKIIAWIAKQCKNIIKLAKINE